MSVSYKAVHWNPQKRIYDLVILLLVFAASVTFATISKVLHPEATVETLFMRGSSFLAIFLLQVLLCIGPLTRINAHFLPLLYNRRHLGITIFLLSSVHGAIAIIQHHLLGDLFPFISLFTSYANEVPLVLDEVSSPRNLPFEPFGAFALFVFYLMAITSHDFWLRLLGPARWKSLHLMVYVAYAALLLHLALGLLQSELHVVYPILFLGGFVIICFLHAVAALCNARQRVTGSTDGSEDAFVKVCDIADLEEGRGKTVRIGKDRIAVFRDKDRIFALSGVCRHQGGPIGEGRIVDGCVTCPWHGWQYDPKTGESPPPFDEHLPTFPVSLRDGFVFVDPTPLPRGATCPDALASPIENGPDTVEEEAAEPFYVGYHKEAPEGIQNYLNAAGVFLILACPLFMAIVAAAQSSVDYGTFEFGSAYEVEGVFYATPVPSLYVTPDWTESSAEGQHILLCAQGKFGIPDTWSAVDGKRVRLAGSVVYRDRITMLEVDDRAPPESLGIPTERQERPDTEIVGPVHLVGELVDTKCYLGVMRPATGKVHRACAIRCLSGGVPPGILVKSRGYSMAILLAGQEGDTLSYDVTLAGLPIEVAGTLHRENGFSFIRVDSLSRYSGFSG